MSTTERHTIVVGTDGSGHSARAVRWAVREAQLRHAEIELVHAYRHDDLTGVSSTAVREMADRLLADVIAQHRDLLDTVAWRRTTVAVTGNAAQAVVDASGSAQMIVMGTRGLGGLRELVLGSTSHSVLTHATVPVALLRESEHSATISSNERDGLRPLVVGVDTSSAAQYALRWALDEAQRRGVGVLVVHGLDAPDAAELRVLGLSPQLVAMRLAETRAAARDDVDKQIHQALPISGTVPIDRIVDDAAPAAALLRHATTEHLLVVGRRGHRTAELGLGSVSQHCAHHATGPTVIVPHVTP